MPIPSVVVYVAFALICYGLWDRALDAVIAGRHTTAWCFGLASVVWLYVAAMFHLHGLAP